MAACWQKLSTDFNRFIQKYRRLHNVQVQYIRAVEAHLDTYPHIHIVLQFPDARISVDNARYFNNVLYAKWKQLWTFGLSDYQPPRSKRLPVLYLIKYISKDTPTYKTLWKKMYADAPATKVQDSDNTQTTTPAQIVSTPTPTTPNPTLELCKFYKVKQLSWSRGFAFPPMARRPESVPLAQTLLDLPRK